MSLTLQLQANLAGREPVIESLGGCSKCAVELCSWQSVFNSTHLSLAREHLPQHLLDDQTHDLWIAEHRSARCHFENQFV